MVYTDDLAVFLSLQLLPQEHLWWWSRPVASEICLPLRDVYGWFAGTCVVAATCSALISTGSVPPLMGAGVGSLLTGFLFAWSIYQLIAVLGWRERLRNTVYGVTDRRIMLLLPGKIPSLLSFTSEEIGDITVDEGPDGFGTVCFGTSMSRRHTRNGTLARSAFIGIANPSHVARLLSLLQANRDQQGPTKEDNQDMAGASPRSVILLPEYQRRDGETPDDQMEGEALNQQMHALEREQLSVPQTEQAIVTFVHAHFTQAIPLLEHLLESQHASVRMSALVALTLDWHLQDYWSSAIAFLNDPCLLCRETAIEVLEVLMCSTNQLAILSALAEVVSNQQEQMALRARAGEIVEMYSDS